MRRLVGLLGKNKKGPRVYIGEFGKPLLHVEGAEGELSIFHCNRQDEEEQLFVIAGNGRHPIPASKFCRIQRDHVSDILCLITSG